MMKVKLFFAAYLSFFMLISCSSRNPDSIKAGNENLVQYIKPLIGTNNDGNVFPGPSFPHGMVQLSPDTDKRSWETASGYEYADTTLYGFSMQHLSGTGIPDLGDFLILPTKGRPKSGKTTPFSHVEEKAEAGYYSVNLEEYNIKAELAASPRAGILRFTFPKSDSSNIMIDLGHVLQWRIVWSHVRVEDKSLVTGYHLVNGWARERRLFFAARFSKPYDSFAIIKNSKRVFYNTRRFTSKYEAFGRNLQFVAGYKTNKDEVILVKIGISAVSAANALMNLDTEIPDWDFDKVVLKNRAAWEKEMHRMQVKGPEDVKETFYTALYHSLLTPTIYDDVDGAYRGEDKNIHHAENFQPYAIFSLWDTYRALHPLYTLIDQKRDVDMINSMLALYDQSVDKLLPIWSLNNTETWCMIGYHAVSVIADACLKGLKGFDCQRAYKAVKTTAMNPDYDSVKEYARIGYVPFDHENESVSKTLEYAYDDYCIARMANKLGKKDDYKYFMKRAASYKNIFDPSTNLMRGRDSHGNFRTPFYPHKYIADMNKRDITEGTNWQYTWYVPHDVNGLIKLMKGRAAFNKMLDEFFNYSGKKGKVEEGSEDIGGRFGEYWHGNEPCHHVAYLYDYAGKPWKTQRLIKMIMTSQYGNKPNSLCGNDDCGQMSAWYLFNCMGFYPIAPSSNIYVVGTPCVEKVTVKLAEKRKLIIQAENFSKKNMYIQSMTVNGREWNKPFIPYEEIKNGGEIVYVMGPEPNKQWGVGTN